MEATGNYWISLATFLHQAGFGVAVINPSQAHDFAKLLLRRSKNDQLDAQNLAQLAQTLKPSVWTPPPAIYYELQQRLAHRDSLLDLRQQVRNQLHALLVCPIVIESVQLSKTQLIETLDKQLKTIEKEIEGLLKGSDQWAKSVVLLQTIPGVGLVTACWIVVLTLNLTACTSAEGLVAYAGLAPMERSSGTSVRGRASIGQGGNSRLRTAAFMATLSAVRYNPVLKQFYERLKKEKGKPDRVARCAVARKLLHFAYAIVKKGEAFDPEFVVKQAQKKLAKSAEKTKIGA
jgi:transposase